MTKSEARGDLGLLLRKYREQMNLKRPRLAEISGIDKGVIIKLEHGVQNPTRCEFRKIINCLRLPPEAREKAGRMLAIIYPRDRIKFHLHISVLKKRRCVYRTHR